MNKIVVLSSRRPLEDRSWMCHNKGEADTLAKWLRENFIDATAYSTESWNELNAKEDKS